MTESIEINVRGGVASAEGGGSGSDKVGGLGFIGGRSASLLGRTIGGAMSAAIGATPAIAAILVIADVLKTAMAPALKMISAILKVLGAIFMPVGIIIMMLLRPVLMILLPILKFMWLIWRPHMMKIAHAAKDMKEGKISKSDFIGVVMDETMSFFGELFSKVLTTVASSALASLKSGWANLLKENANLQEKVPGVTNKELADTKVQLSPLGEGYFDPFFTGLKSALEDWKKVFNPPKNDPWKLVAAGKDAESEYTPSPQKPQYLLNLEKTGEAAGIAWKALNFGENSLAPSATTAAGIILKTSNQMTLFGTQGIVPATTKLTGANGFTLAIGSAITALGNMEARFNNANFTAGNKLDSASYEKLKDQLWDDVRKELVSRGIYVR